MAVHRNLLLCADITSFPTRAFIRRENAINAKHYQYISIHVPQTDWIKGDRVPVEGTLATKSHVREMEGDYN